MDKRTQYSGSLQSHLQELQAGGKSLRDMARLYGKPITHADIQRSLEGQYPVDPSKRQALGLPALVPVPACSNPDCAGYGEPHTWDCKTQTVKNRRRRSPAHGGRGSKKTGEKTYTQKRRERLDEIARKRGWKSWSAFETAIYRGRADFEDPYP